MAMLLIKKRASDVADRCTIIETDLSDATHILDADVTGSFTVFAYDRVMNQEVLANIALLLNREQPRVFASFQLPSKWAMLGLEMEHFDTISACKTTGNQSFTCYLFRPHKQQ